MEKNPSVQKRNPESSTQKHPLYDLEKLRQQAKRSMEEGALTESYPLDVHQACQFLNEALATEIFCVLRYRHHQIIARGINALDVADEFREHAENEQEHMLMIAERINQLGGDPDFNPSTLMQRTVSEYGKADDLIGMIREDLVSERLVIDVYRKLIEWFGAGDPTTRRMLEKILADEEEHAEELADLLVRRPISH